MNFDFAITYEHVVGTFTIIYVVSFTLKHVITPRLFPHSPSTKCLIRWEETSYTTVDIKRYN